MPRPESLLRVNSPVSESLTHPRLGIPVRFHADAHTDERMFETDTQIMGGQLLPLFDAGETIIDYDRIIPIALHTFDNPAFLENTLAGLGNKGKVQAVDVCNLQMGTFAIHLLYTVQTTEGVSHFVSYVSRFDRDSKTRINNVGTLTGTHAEADFQNLTFLHERFMQQSEQVRRRYGVVQPLAFDYVPQLGKEFGVYTTVFEDLGELHVSARPLNGIKVGDVTFADETVPYYYYGSPIDKHMSYENDILKRNCDEAVRKYDARGKTKPEAIPQFAALIKQQRELALANAIVYLVGDSHYPADVTINAGDWMTDFHHAKFGVMKLVTTRGALIPMDDMDWIDMMHNKKEKDIFPSGDFYHKPYAQLTRWDLRTILDYARKLTGIR